MMNVSEQSQSDLDGDEAVRIYRRTPNDLHELKIYEMHFHTTSGTLIHFDVKRSLITTCTYYIHTEGETMVLKQ